MPARLHAAIALTGIALLLIAITARRADGADRPWRWPVHGELAGSFRVTPAAPFAAGQRRGIRIAAGSGTTVRAACGGQVMFAGSVGRAGRTLSVRCGGLLATYQGLGELRVHRGMFVGQGDDVATVATSGVLRLGARRAPGRYVDPLTLLGPDPAPPLGPAPRPDVRPPRWTPAPADSAAPTTRGLPSLDRPAPADAPPLTARVPLPAWLGLALLTFGTPLGALAHRRRARTLAARTLSGTRA